MSVAAPISLPFYLAHPTEPESEYLDGELYQKAMGSKPHSRLQKLLIILLDRYEQDGLGQVSVEQSLQLDEKTILIPDVCLLQPGDSAYHLVTEPPLLCVEILSPSDRFAFTAAKCRRYLDWGVIACWVLDPEAKRAWISDSAGLREIANGGTLAAGSVVIEISDVFPLDA